MFTEHDFLNRFAAASNTGFQGVEFMFPYEYKAEQIHTVLDRYNLTPVLFNLPPGDLQKGDRGLACLPDRINEFRESVDVALQYAAALGCRQLHCMSGVTSQEIKAADTMEVYEENLQYAATVLGKEGITVLIEPINQHDMPGYVMHSIKSAAEIIERIGSDHLGLQYDAYHMEKMQENLEATLTDYLPLVRHIQIADAPGRHEPGTGNIDFQKFFELLNRLEYRHWVGCEYQPLQNTNDGLIWMDKYAIAMTTETPL